MKTRQIASIQREVSEIGLALRSVEGVDAELPRAAHNSGITYFEAGGAETETLLGAQLGDALRNHLVGITTSAESPETDCEAALGRLGLEQVGVLWVKVASAEAVTLETALAKAKALQSAGKAQTFGFDLTPLAESEQIAAGQWAMANDLPLLKITYSLHEPRVGRELFALAGESATRFVVVLPKETTALDEWLGADLAEIVSVFARKTQHLRFLTNSGRSLAQATIKFALAQAAVVCVLPAVTSLGDLLSAVAAADAPDLTRAELNRIDDLVVHNFHLEPFEPPTAYNG